MRKGRPPVADSEARVIEVEHLYLKGHSRAEIIVLTKKWGVSERTINKYISRATEKINDISQNSADNVKSLILTRLWNLARKAEESTDVKEEHKLLMSLAIGPLLKYYFIVQLNT